MREQIQELEKAAEEYDARLQKVLTGIPEHAARQRTRRENAPRQCGSPALGHAAEVSISLPSPIGNSANSWVCLIWNAPPNFPERALLSTGTWARAGTRAGKLHARSTYRAAWLHRGAAALSGEFRIDVWHWTACQSSPRSFPRSSWRQRSLADSYRRSSRSPIFIAMKCWMPPRLPISSPPTRHAFAAKLAHTAKMCAALSGSTNFRKWSWSKFSRPEDSYDELEKLTHDAEERSAETGLALSRDDSCVPATWDSPRPRRTTLKSGCRDSNLFREISSCSNFESFQARRANIRFRPRGKKQERICAYA